VTCPRSWSRESSAGRAAWSRLGRRLLSGGTVNRLRSKPSAARVIVVLPGRFKPGAPHLDVVGAWVDRHRRAPLALSPTESEPRSTVEPGDSGLCRHDDHQARKLVLQRSHPCGGMGRAVSSCPACRAADATLDVQRSHALGRSPPCVRSSRRGSAVCRCSHRGAGSPRNFGAGLFAPCSPSSASDLRRTGLAAAARFFRRETSAWLVPARNGNQHEGQGGHKWARYPMRTQHPFADNPPTESSATTAHGHYAL